MGWKNIKEHYGVTHLVSVQPEGICIGSGYVPGLIVIREGKVSSVSPLLLSSSPLQTVLDRMRADPEKLLELELSKDIFLQSLPVYTFEGSRVIREYCEEYGWPNTTHSGKLMYDNLYFKTWAEALDAAKKDAAAKVKFLSQIVEEEFARLSRTRQELEEARTSQRKLEGLNVA
jgi:hypothetical protein